MSSLTTDQVALQLEGLAGWQQEGNSLIKTYEFKDFASAIVFMTHSSFYAEQLEHYPLWENYHNIIKVRIGDVEQSAVQSRDVQLAKRLETVANKALI